MNAEISRASQVARPASPSFLPEKFLRDSTFTKLRLAFARHHYVALPGLFSAPSAFAKLSAEVSRLEQFANKKNFVMPGYNTPRVMATVGGRAIKRESSFLTAMYAAGDLATLVSQITGQPVYPCLDENEWMVINWLEGPGKTHGWHLDDPPYALVIFVQAPAPGQGGEAEYITDWRRLCQQQDENPEGDVAAAVEGCRELGLVNSKTHAAGDAYLLRADRCLHRVAPITSEGARRVILNLAFEAKPNAYRKGVTAAYLYEN
jgi:hypothetical protein